MASNSGRKASEIFQAQALLYRNMFGFIDSMCLKWIIELGIPNIIHNHAKPITLSELVSMLKVPQVKFSTVDRLMRYMVHNGFFEVVRIHDDDDENNQEENEAFALTAASELLVKGTDPCLAPMVECMLDPALVDPFHQMGKWIYEEDRPLFEVASGMPFWNFLDKSPVHMSLFNDAMASDSQIIKLVWKDHKVAFEGLESIVDVGGGTGTTARVICETFPTLKCIVFDLPQVVDKLSGSDNLSFVGGDMFKSIPKADAVLLKWVLHDWSDENCKKILENCKEAVSSKDKRGKLIILDVVINEKQDKPEITRTKLLLDIIMQALHGKERTEDEWKELFSAVGFQDYKICPFNGYFSIIEVYP